MASIVAAWPEVALGHVVKPVERPEAPSVGTTYRQVGVKLWGQGAYEREPVDGGATHYKSLSRVEADDIIVNKIWARNRSVSVVTPELAGCYVSSEFPTFAPLREKLLPEWFRWLTKTRRFWEQCDQKSRGTSGKNRIRPEKFLEIGIPLPPVDEQRRIVAHIEELAARIEQAKGLRREALVDVAGLIPSAVEQYFELLSLQYAPIELLEICRFVGGGQPPKSMFKYESTPGYVRFLQIRDFSSDDYLTYIPVSPANRLAKPEDVLIARYGSANQGASSLGRVLRGKEGAYNVAICKAVPVRDEVDLGFLAVMLAHGNFQARLRELSRTVQSGFNRDDLRGVKYPMPRNCSGGGCGGW